MDVELSELEREHRRFWVGEIRKLSGIFGEDTARLEAELGGDVRSRPGALLNHLRMCGDIPEGYGHDSSEEKAYSKYTDSVIAETFRHLGLTAKVLTERADAADVEVSCPAFSFVADAKAFRLSRTAKNQKDFKIQAMDGWRGDRTYALVVCPAYHLPGRSSQIYAQASTRKVCILTYSHLALLVQLADIEGLSSSQRLLEKIFQRIVLLTPSKSADSYWTAVNSAFLTHSSAMPPIWRTEKRIILAVLQCSKESALQYLATERDRIRNMSHDQAIQELLRIRRIDERSHTIQAVITSSMNSLGALNMP